MSALFTCKTEHWLTPPEVLEVIRPLGGITYDPCSHPQSLTQAPFSNSEGVGNGLLSGWAIYTDDSDGVVYVNPPYGRALPAWARRIRTEADAGCGIIALVPARVDTGWWRTLSPRVWCAWKGRIKFWQPTPDGAKPGGPAPFPTALCYFGPRQHLFADALSARGVIYWEM